MGNVRFEENSFTLVAFLLPYKLPITAPLSKWSWLTPNKRSYSAMKSSAAGSPCSLARTV
eukprot:5974382-Amphidinium_carterae.1